MSTKTVNFSVFLCVALQLIDWSGVSGVPVTPSNYGPSGAQPPSNPPSSYVPSGAPAPSNPPSNYVPSGAQPPSNPPSNYVPSGAQPPSNPPSNYVPSGAQPPSNPPSNYVPSGAQPPSNPPSNYAPSGATPPSNPPSNYVPSGAPSPSNPPGSYDSNPQKLYIPESDYDNTNDNDLKSLYDLYGKDNVAKCKTKLKSETGDVETVKTSILSKFLANACSNENYATNFGLFNKKILGSEYRK